MKNLDVLKVWNDLKGSKFGKMTGDGKIKFVKIIAKLTPVMDAYDKYRETIVTKLQEEHEGFSDKMEVAQAYEKWKQNGEGEQPKMTEQEYQDFVKEVIEYNSAVNKALEDKGNEEVDVTIDKLTSTEFGCFLDSNDFTAEQAMALGNVMCAFE